VLRGEQTIADAASEMRSHSHGSAMICRDGKLIGIFTERDLMKRLAEGKTLEEPLSKAMTAQPRTVSLDDSLMTVIQLMDGGGYRRLPVVDGAGSPVGVVDVKSVVHFLVEHFPKAVYNQAPRALLQSRDREGA
jgi:CBS domain-containing protein